MMPVEETQISHTVCSVCQRRGYPLNETDPYLLAIDLSNDWTNSSVSIQSISKPTIESSLVSGGLWVDQGVLYTGFAGRQSRFNTTSGTATRGLWSFIPDGKGSGSWSPVENTANADWSSLARPYDPLVAAGNGVGYFLGGFEVNDTQADSGNGSSDISGMITYNFTSKTVSNDSVTGVYMGGVDQMGGMQFVENFGPEGILVAFGGDQVGKIHAGSGKLLLFHVSHCR
jgi:hypothetical protein